MLTDPKDIADAEEEERQRRRDEEKMALMQDQVHLENLRWERYRSPCDGNVCPR